MGKPVRGSIANPFDGDSRELPPGEPGRLTARGFWLWLSRKICVDPERQREYLPFGFELAATLIARTRRYFVFQAHTDDMIVFARIPSFVSIWNVETALAS